MSVTLFEHVNQQEGEIRALKSMPVMIHSINNKGEIIDVNDYWLEKMEFKREEVLGRKSVDFLTHESKQRALTVALPKFFKDKFCRDYPYTFVTKSGKHLDILLSASSKLDHEGNLLQSYAISIDVTERNKLYRQLKDSELRYRTMIKQMLNGFALQEIICNDEGQPVDYRFLEVNSAFEEMMGLEGEQIVGKTLLELFPEAENKWIETFGNVALSSDPIHFERYSRQLQKYFDVLAYSPAENQCAVVITDISERKRVEEDLRDNEKLLRRVFDNSPIGIAIVDLDFHYASVNKEFCRISGYSKEKLLRMNTLDLTCKEDQPLAQRRINDLIEDKVDHFHYEHRIVRNGGELLWVRTSLRLMRDSHGKPVFFVPMVEDIHEKKLLNNEQDTFITLLEIITADTCLKDLVEALLGFIKNLSGVDAIGIRLRNGAGFPYYYTDGFPEDFISQENHSLSESHTSESVYDCMCGYVLEGIDNSDPSLCTSYGCFCAISTSRFIAKFQEMDNPPVVRGPCHAEGFRSILLVPLRVGDSMIGLLQLNHRQKEYFQESFISLMEKISYHVSVAIAHRQSVEKLTLKQMELQENNTALKVLIRNREEDIQGNDREMLRNIERFVLPYIDQLKVSNLDENQKLLLNILEGNLNNITSPISRKMISVNSMLTPTLIRVADMIRNGLTNKEIASTMGISVSSVETYRKRIRARLNLQNSAVNLCTYLNNPGDWDSECPSKVPL